MSSSQIFIDPQGKGYTRETLNTQLTNLNLSRSVTDEKLFIKALAFLCVAPLPAELTRSQVAAVKRAVKARKIPARVYGESYGKFLVTVEDEVNKIILN